MSHMVQITCLTPPDTPPDPYNNSRTLSQKLKIFNIFRNFDIFSSYYNGPRAAQTYGPRIFPDLSLRMAQSTYNYLQTDGNSLDLKHKHSSKNQLLCREIPLFRAPRFSESGPGDRRILLEKTEAFVHLYKPPDCAR